MDRPTKLELLEAVRQFLDRELVPELEGVHRFHARVAGNVLGIVAREIELEGPALRRRHAALAELLACDRPAPLEPPALAREVEALERELAERIRAGQADAAPERERVLACLWVSVRERLTIANPTYR